jgi:hypothetical protein
MPSASSAMQPGKSARADPRWMAAMNMRKFFAELRRRNVYKVAILVVAWLVDSIHHSLKSPACSCVSMTLPAAW